MLAAIGGRFKHNRVSQSQEAVLSLATPASCRSSQLNQDTAPITTDRRVTALQPSSMLLQKVRVSALSKVAGRPKVGSSVQLCKSTFLREVFGNDFQRTTRACLLFIVRVGSCLLR